MCLFYSLPIWVVPFIAPALASQGTAVLTLLWNSPDFVESRNKRMKLGERGCGYLEHPRGMQPGRGENMIELAGAPSRLVSVPRLQETRSGSHLDDLFVAVFPRLLHAALSASQIVCDQCQHFLHLEGFGEKIIGTSILRHALCPFLGREENNRNVAGGRLSFEVLTNGSPICAREPDIQEQQIRERLERRSSNRKWTDKL
jgi:hypothetical protein